MELQCLGSDRISTLPQNTRENILTLMPIQDALKTSILSRNWRYCWTGMPNLVFDDNMVKVSFDSVEINKYKLGNAIFHVLLQHKGPILELDICITRTEIVNVLDQIILHLSRSNTMKKFIFTCFPYHYYKLPCSFFSLHGLEHISLAYCALEPPLIFNGFSVLKSLSFYEIEINVKTLHRFLTKCPLLEELTLTVYVQDYLGEDKFPFVELSKCLSLVSVLKISKLYMEYFSAGDMPQKLPTLLVHLRILVLEVCLQEQDGLASALCVISSSPNLEKIKIDIWCHDRRACALQPFTNRFDLQGLNFDHLKELEITRFSNIASEMMFVNMIMAKSPMLKKVRIVLHFSVSVDEEMQMLRNMLQFPFPCASPAASIVIERP